MSEKNATPSCRRITDTITLADTITDTITLAEPLSVAGAHSLAKQVDQLGKTKRALTVQNMDIPEGSRLRRVGEARRDTDAMLWHT